MIALYILLGLLFLLLLPIHGRFLFEGEGHLTVRLVGIPVYRFSTEKKEKKPPKKTKPQAGGKKEKDNPVKRMTSQLKEQGADGVIGFLGELIRLFGGTLRRLLRVLRFGRCRVRVAVGGPDAADIALRYGKLCGPLAVAEATLAETLSVRRLQVEVYPDFLREKDLVVADIRLRTTPLSLLWVAIQTMFVYLGMIVRVINKKSEDGQNG